MGTRRREERKPGTADNKRNVKWLLLGLLISLLVLTASLKVHIAGYVSCHVVFLVRYFIVSPRPSTRLLPSLSASVRSGSSYT